MIYELKGLTFVQTGAGYPECYDIRNSYSQRIARMQLENGCLSCEMTDKDGILIYEEELDVAHQQGSFVSGDQMVFYFNKIADAILEKMGVKNKLNNMDIYRLCGIISGTTFTAFPGGPVVSVGDKLPDNAIIAIAQAIINSNVSFNDR